MADTWTEIEAKARVKGGDNASVTVNRCVSSAEALAIANDDARRLAVLYEPIEVVHASTTSGLSLAANGYTDTTTPANYRRIMSVSREAAAGNTYGRTLQIKSTDEVQALRDDWLDRVGATGPPTACAMYRLQGATTGQWGIVFHPPADATYYFSVRAELGYTDMTVGSSVPELPPEGCALLVDLLAFRMACIARQPADFIASILTFMPDQKRASAVLGMEIEKLQGQILRGRASG